MSALSDAVKASWHRFLDIFEPLRPELYRYCRYLDLIDEYMLLVHPVILGQGLPLFKEVAQERELQLVRTRAFSSGVVLLQYARDRVFPL